MIAQILDLGHLVKDFTFDLVLEMDFDMKSTWTLDVLYLLGKEIEDPSMVGSSCFISSRHLIVFTLFFFLLFTA